MEIKRCPQFNMRDNLFYNVDEEMVTVNLNGIEESFDLSQFTEDGKYDIIPNKLPINPFIKVERVNGVLNVDLLDYYNDPHKYRSSEVQVDVKGVD